MIFHLLNSSAVVYRPSFTADGRGGRARSVSVVGTVRAKVSQPTAAEREEAARLGAELRHVVHMEASADVRRGDEIDTGSGRRLRVVDVVTNSRETYLRLECEGVQGV